MSGVSQITYYVLFPTRAGLCPEGLCPEGLLLSILRASGLWTKAAESEDLNAWNSESLTEGLTVWSGLSLKGWGPEGYNFESILQMHMDIELQSFRHSKFKAWFSNFQTSSWSPQGFKVWKFSKIQEHVNLQHLTFWKLEGLRVWWLEGLRVWKCESLKAWKFESLKVWEFESFGCVG